MQCHIIIYYVFSGSLEAVVFVRECGGSARSRELMIIDYILERC